MMKKTNLPITKPNPPKAGQSLVEFVLVMPIFLLVLLGGAYMGFNFYQAQMASDAVRQVALHKMDLANTPQAAQTGTVAGYINQGNTKGSMSLGNFVDAVSFVDSDEYASFVVGKKQTAGVLSIIPGLNIQVNQAINKNLLLPATAGTAVVRPATTPWVPFGTPAVPPWEGGATATTTAPATALVPATATAPAPAPATVPVTTG